MKLYNSLTKSVEDFRPLDGTTARIYSCGPTVYDYVHIGNLSAFITADLLRRALTYAGTHRDTYSVQHVMNFTDVDDKTIRRSRAQHPDLEPKDALQKLTTQYSDAFLHDMQAIGNDTAALTFVRATDPETIDGMKQLISSLHEKGFAYIADDGVYFSIDAYRKSGKTYGQLVELTSTNTSNARIQNDEYDKDSIHDFALWKTQKPGEPAWEFNLNGIDLHGRPGWHIECSVMSAQALGVPFDIHTGGIDLQFPHHENEIAQSTAGAATDVYAHTFVHNEHVLVDGKKMSKSLGNFYTLRDLEEQGVSALAFRMLVLQSHYRKSTQFSFDNATAAHNRLHHWRNIAALRHQIHDTLHDDDDKAMELRGARTAFLEALYNDLDTPNALRSIDETFDSIEKKPLHAIQQRALVEFLEAIDETLGLQLIQTTPDILDVQKKTILARTRAREEKDWATSDALRDQLLKDGIELVDTVQGSIWRYV